MNNTAGKLPMQNADKTFLSICATAKRYLKQIAGLTGKIVRNICSGLRQSNPMAMDCIESRRVNDADKQSTRQHPRDGRANAA